MERYHMEGYDTRREWELARGWCVICKGPCYGPSKNDYEKGYANFTPVMAQPSQAVHICICRECGYEMTYD